MNEPDETRYRIALSRIKGINLASAELLLKTYGSAMAIFREKAVLLQSLCGVNGSVFAEEKRVGALDFADREIEFMRRSQITPLFFTDDGYPARLRECTDAPLVLFYRGNANLNGGKVISIVGTRHATSYGKSFCSELLSDLSAVYPDLTIVSGLAYGIDIAAHRAALREGLPTIGVLAHGLNTIYPPVHRSTAVEMLNQGGLLTEYASQQSIHKGNFVARNRIVAGMADATLVVESAGKGGALITAGIAGSYGRDVFALPGRVGDIYSEGCNRLIANNQAGLITSANELIDAMCWKRPEVVSQPTLFLELSMDESRLLDLLREGGECQINQLTAVSDLSTSRVLAALMELEFKGLARPHPGGVYRPC